MKNLFFVFFISFACIKVSVAQPGQLIVKGGDKGIHLEHPVAAKEGLFAIARLYNVHPKFLAAFNNLDMNKGLSIGQVINIPLTDTNFSQRIKTSTPVYYRVGEKEGLLKVSNMNNKVKLQSLREWNKLSNDNIGPGSTLIIGFLISGETTSVTAALKEEQKKVTEEKPPVKTEPVVEKTVVKEEGTTSQPDMKVEVKKPEPRKAQPVFIKQEVTANMSGQGYFKSFFDQQIKVNPVSKTETVTAGIFKTTNGLQDAKYYLLIDGVSPGTIVRIINPENNRAVYAKVLGEMNGIRQNQGLTIRISNMAATILGITDTDKFIVKINF